MVGVTFRLAPDALRRWPSRLIAAASLDRPKLCALLRAVILEEHPVIVFSPQPANDGATVYSRVFAPGLGIPEDHGTGARANAGAPISSSTTPCQPTRPRGS